MSEAFEIDWSLIESMSCLVKTITTNGWGDPLYWEVQGDMRVLLTRDVKAWGGGETFIIHYVYSQRNVRICVISSSCRDLLAHRNG